MIKSISSIPLLSQIFKIMKSLDIDGISRSYLQCRHILAAVATKKYECNWENIAGTFANQKYAQVTE